jgi:hypothetical protein
MLKIYNFRYATTCPFKLPKMDTFHICIWQFNIHTAFHGFALTHMLQIIHIPYFNMNTRISISSMPVLVIYVVYLIAEAECNLTGIIFFFNTIVKCTDRKKLVGIQNILLDFLQVLSKCYKSNYLFFIRNLIILIMEVKLIQKYSSFPSLISNYNFFF